MTQQVPEYIRLIMLELDEHALKYKYTRHGAHMYEQLDILDVRSHSMGWFDDTLALSTKNGGTIELWCLDPSDLMSAQQLRGDVLRLCLLDHRRQLYVPPHLRPRPASV
jgi:hypothetical protein